MSDYPKLRNVDILPVEISGKKLLLLRDRLFLSRELTLPIEGARIISLFNGNLSLLDIQATIMRQSGFQLVSFDQIKGLADALDSNFYLDNENFKRRKEQIEDQFRKEDVRKSSHAGNSYEADPERLRAQIDHFFYDSKGPGAPPEIGSGNRIKGLIAPHIDYGRGGTCYAWAYHKLAEESNAELFVILGTAHMPTSNLFVLTEKDFETPLGVQKTDRSFVREILSSTNDDLLCDELLHRSEHTIELQILLLQYLYGGKRDIEIVPILCGSFHSFIERGGLPSGDEQLVRVSNAIREAIDSSGKKACLIASADLSHIGPQFGQPNPVQSYDLPGIQKNDLEMLRFVEKLDREGFYRFIMEEKDRRNICGLPPIYALLSAIECRRAEIIKYDQAPHPHATVTFASMAFWD
jgi:AmmeMemoRadiSam system protein B